MAVTIANLNIKLSATSTALRKGLRKAGDSVSRFGKRAGSASAGGKLFGSVIGKLPGGLGAIATAAGPVGLALAVVTAAAAAAALAIRKTLQQFGEIDRIAKFSDQIGFSTEAIAAYRLGAELTGTKVETLEKGLQRFSRQIGEAKAGTTESIRAFADLGLTVEDLNGLSPEEAFKKTADAIKNLPGPAEKAAAAYRLFGRQGQDLLTFFEAGSTGIDGFQRRAKELGATFSRFDAAKVEAANDAIAEMKTAFTGLFRQVATNVAPAVSAFARVTTETFIGISEVFRVGTIAARDFFSMLTFGLITSSEKMKQLEKAAASAASKGLAKTSSDAAASAAAFDKLAKGSDGASEAVNKWVGIGERLTRELESPFEKASNRVAEIKGALDAGTISWETYRRGIEKVARAFATATEKKDAFNAPDSKIAAVRRGTAEAFRATADLRTADRARRDLATKQLREAERQTAFLKQIENKPPVVVKKVGGLL